jgi:hypothetical protein
MNVDEFEGQESTALLLWRHTEMGHEVVPSTDGDVAEQRMPQLFV